MKRIAVGLVAFSFVIASSASAQVSIDFDDTGAPCSFDETTGLTSFYSGQGVNFSGNGSILNECGNFHSEENLNVFSGHSGTDFLAYNDDATGLPATESIMFDSPQSYFSIWIGVTSGVVFDFYLSGSPVEGDLVFLDASIWNQYASSSAVFDRVDIFSGDPIMILDDLSTRAVPAGSTVPEPATLTLMATGLLGLAAHRRRRRRS